MNKEDKNIYTMEFYSAIKKNENNAIYSNMDGPRDYYTKWRKSERERQISYHITYVWNLKKWYKWTYLQIRNRPRHRKQTYDYRGGKGGGVGINWKYEINRHTLLCIK